MTIVSSNAEPGHQSSSAAAFVSPGLKCLDVLMYVVALKLGTPMTEFKSLPNLRTLKVSARVLIIRACGPPSVTVSVLKYVRKQCVEIYPKNLAQLMASKKSYGACEDP